MGPLVRYVAAGWGELPSLVTNVTMAWSPPKQCLARAAAASKPPQKAPNKKTKQTKKKLACVASR